MTNHAVCERKFTDLYEKVVKSIALTPKRSAEECASRHVASEEWAIEHGEGPSSMEGLVEECQNSTLTLNGVTKLRARALDVTGAWSQKHKEILRINDCFQITAEGGCEFTSDGRHYPKLVPTELRGFLKLVRDDLMLDFS